MSHSTQGLVDSNNKFSKEDVPIIKPEENFDEPLTKISTDTQGEVKNFTLLSSNQEKNRETTTTNPPSFPVRNIKR